MFRLTGESKYQEIAWDMFQAIETNTKTEFGNAALQDIMATPPPKSDSMEASPGYQNAGETDADFSPLQSFWLAETLKYFYLIFSDHDEVSLDDFVFNTEAHPFRIPYR